MFLIFILVIFSIKYRSSFCYTPGNIALLDHLNFNHEKSRHDLLKSFYFDTLGLTADPRKIENIAKGRKTLWANAGITQFHLPEASTAQVFDGLITISYKSESDLNIVYQRLMILPDHLRHSKCKCDRVSSCELLVSDPWGSSLMLVVNEKAEDSRGTQSGEPSLPCAISDLCFNVPKDASLEGIGRFYDQILGAPILIHECDRDREIIKIITSPQQTLSFKKCFGSSRIIDHSEVKMDEEGIANYGPHISMYLYDFVSAYKNIEKLNGIFINHRFKRRAYNLEEALDQCMFRCLDIIDPLNVSNGPIIRLEHEIRSILTVDGKKYKSCPFYEIPTKCTK